MKTSDTPRTDAAYSASTGAGIYELFNEAQELERELASAKERIRRLEEAGDALASVANTAEDDIRQHLQVANYNLNGLLNTGDRIDPPNPPHTIHQAGIDASVVVCKAIRNARSEWKQAKEAKP